MSTSLMRMLDQISQSFDDQNFWNYPNFKYPLVNLAKTKDGKFKFEFALAGFDESELQVEAGPGYIDVIGIPSTRDYSSHVWRNFTAKPFNVRIKVPDVDSIGTPEFVNGVLSIELGAAAAEKPRKLTIKKPIKE